MAQDSTAKKKAKPTGGADKKRAGAGNNAAAAAAAAAAAGPADPEAARIANQRKLQKMVIRMRAKGKTDKEIRKAKIEFKREVSLKQRIADPATTPRAEPKQKKLTPREQHVAEWKERNQPEAAVKGKKHNLVIVPVLWRNKEEESADILAACATIKKYLSSFGLDVWIDERTKCVAQFSPSIALLAATRTAACAPSLTAAFLPAPSRRICVPAAPCDARHYLPHTYHHIFTGLGTGTTTQTTTMKTKTDAKVHAGAKVRILGVPGAEAAH